MKIDVVRTECGSGDCELGCYNTGYGGYIVIDGVKVFEKAAWAGCCDNSQMSYTELLQQLMNHLKIDATITLSDECEDDEYGDYEDED